MDVLDYFGGEGNPAVVHISVDAFVSPLDAKDILDTIVVMEAHDELSNDHIQARAQTSTSDNGHLGLGWIAEQVDTRTCLHELDGLGDVLVVIVLGVSCREIVVLYERVF